MSKTSYTSIYLIPAFNKLFRVALSPSKKLVEEKYFERNIKVGQTFWIAKNIKYDFYYIDSIVDSKEECQKYVECTLSYEEEKDVKLVEAMLITQCNHKRFVVKCPSCRLNKSFVKALLPKIKKMYLK